MRGIVGYVGDREAAPILMSGLRRLEYRGYDSAGVAVANGEAAEVVRCRGKLANLEKRLAEHEIHGNMGIGHTRWATHGRPSDQNAHPHKVGRASVVHNGIIENHETDTEVLDAGWSDCGTPDRLFQALEKGGELTKLLTRLEGLSFTNDPLVASAARAAGSTGTFSTEEGAHA